MNRKLINLLSSELIHTAVIIRHVTHVTHREVMLQS